MDNNAYPPDYSAVLAPRALTQYRTLIKRLEHLTTPIAYITSVIPAPLNEIVANNGARLADNSGPVSSAPFRVGGLTSTAPLITPVVYDYAQYERKSLPLEVDSVWLEITSNLSTIAWGLNSNGPNGKVFQYLGSGNLTVYDPTNGTVSYGQIIRTNISAEDKPKNL